MRRGKDSCKMHVAVIGAGVIGLTSAIALKTAYPEYPVTIFADIFTPNTTGDGSAGLWGPFLLDDTPEEDILKWSGVTHRWFENFWKAGLALETGLCLQPVLRVTSEIDRKLEPSWTKVVYGAHRFTTDELKSLNDQHRANYVSGWHFVTYSCEPKRLLPWLTKKFVALGGELVKRKIRDINELIEDGYELVINCSGLGARELVDDDTVIPLRGQVFRANAPWIMHTFLVDDEACNYVIPNMNTVVLGGTHQEEDYDLHVRDEDAKFIREGCLRIFPSLENAEIVTSWVGLRPGRPRVRLESEIFTSKSGKNCHVIHNYGHGGAGITLSWGCALDVVELVKNLFKSQNSKL